MWMLSAWLPKIVAIVPPGWTLRSGSGCMNCGIAFPAIGICGDWAAGAIPTFKKLNAKSMAAITDKSLLILFILLPLS